MHGLLIYTVFPFQRTSELDPQSFSTQHSLYRSAREEEERMTTQSPGRKTYDSVLGNTRQKGNEHQVVEERKREWHM